MVSLPPLAKQAEISFPQFNCDWKQCEARAVGFASQQGGPARQPASTDSFSPRKGSLVCYEMALENLRIEERSSFTA